MTVWKIAQLERNTADGGVVVAHWRATATETVGEDTFSASSYGTCGFTPDPTAPDFIAFESLTEADVLAWVYESVDKDATEAALAAKIEDQKAALVVITIDGVEYNPEDLSDEDQVHGRSGQRH
jgi:hypothetical protein